MQNDSPSVKPKRIQLRRTKGWRKPEGAVVVAHPSRWGNWYVITNTRSGSNRGWWVGMAGDLNMHGPHRLRSDAAAVAVSWYREDCEEVLRAETDGQFFDSLATLRGHDLACWCPLDQPCHADVLLEIANRDAD